MRRDPQRPPQPPVGLMDTEVMRHRRQRAVEERLLVHSLAHLNPLALGTALGAVLGAGLFLATAVLLARAALLPPPTGEVGPLLGLLSHYFPGYAVTWPGSLLGAVYGFLVGMVLGLAVAGLVNLNSYLYVRRLNRSRARPTAAR